jgi:hypothetical protein
MTTADTMPAEVVLRLERRHAASRWRVDHIEDADRDGLWRAYVTGALWDQRLDPFARRAVRAGLDDAERAVPFLPDPP